MYHHQTQYTVRDEPDPKFGNMLLNSLAAQMASSQPPCNIRFRSELRRSGPQDLLMDIGTELSHLEIVGTLAHGLKPLKSVREKAEVDPLIAIAGGGECEPVQLDGSAGRPITSRSLVSWTSIA
jgi:Mn-containing catalase